ncbi:hypothetical protein [Streptomyces sp. NPDC047928]
MKREPAVLGAALAAVATVSADGSAMASVASAPAPVSRHPGGVS